MADRAAAGGGVSRPLVNASYSVVLTAPGGTMTGAGWMGPGKPIPPMAPPEVAGRTWDYPVAYNLQQRPRPYEAIGFPTLRALADSYDLLRLAIETRKDQMSALKWNIVPRDPKAKLEGDIEKRAKAIEEFLAFPDRVHEWEAWLRLLLEDLFVLDAPTIYRRKARDGSLYSLKPIDGGTIMRVLDDWGDTPEPPNVAYRQILHGVAAVDYTSDQLIYRPRNPRTHKAFGYGPVEQIITLVNIGIRRETWQLNFFSDGNMPDALIGVPMEWTPGQIQAFQDWFDSRLLGNTARRRGATFVPGDVAKGYVPTKDVELFGAGEEWLARVVCYALNLSPQWAVKMMNRATGETAKESAEEEGLEPIKGWVSALINYILRTDFASPDLIHRWEEEEEIDQKSLSEILINETAAGLITLNESRKRRGLDPYALPEADQPMVKTTTGYSPIDPAEALQRAKEMQDVMGPPPGADKPKPGSGGSGGGGSGGGGGGKGGSADKAALPDAVLKALRPITVDRPVGRRATRAIKRAVASALREAGDDLAAQVATALRAASKSSDPPADPPDHGDGRSNDDRLTDIEDTADLDALAARLDLSSLDVMVDAVEAELFDMAADSARKAIAQLGAGADADLVNQVNAAAYEWARERAAELVGKRWNAAGELIDNPNAAFAIDEATREGIKTIIARGLADNIGTPAIADAIQAATLFSAERADLVARTEVSRANEQGKLDGWRGIVGRGTAVAKRWLTSMGDDVCEEICLPNQAQGAIGIDGKFMSGDDAPPGHPNCKCVLIPETGD